MAPLEAWEIVYVKEGFLGTKHGKVACKSCHGGNDQEFSKEAAHVNLTPYPSEDHDSFCTSCHTNESSVYSTSLHQNQNGYYDLFEKRAGFDLRTDEHKKQEFDKECGKCHVSCGQCHISRPRQVNGGFLDGHTFKKLPNMTNNCTACHGSRVGEEYLGARAEIADLHWEKKGKRCDFCHPAEEMHGNGMDLKHRYDVNNNHLPKCEDCHLEEIESNSYHQMHWKGSAGKTVSCYVCHSQPYKNCYGCHTGSGLERPSNIAFKIGKNYNKSTRYPVDFITVRHIPIAPDTYASWGVPDLPNFDSEPTWKMTTPHNIQKWTAQTDTTGGVGCSQNCHNSDYYLKEADLESYEINANQSVIFE